MHTELQNKINLVEAALTEKVHHSYGTEIKLSYESEPRLTLYYRATRLSDIMEVEHFRGDIFTIVAEALEHIKKLPTDKALEEQEIRADLARLIDKAKSFDMPLEFLNPLTESMRKLSSNIIEGPRTPALYPEESLPF